MSMGGGTTTTKTDNEPPSWAKPLFTLSADEAQKLYDSNSGFNTWKGPVTTNFSKDTLGGLSALRSLGDVGSGLMRSGAQSINRAGQQYASLPGQAQGLLGSFASGADGINTEADYRKVLASASGPTSSAKNLADMASGKYLTEGNPYFRELLDEQSSDLAGSVNNMFASGGRYGSRANQGEVLDQVGSFRRENLSDQWNRDQAAMLSANSMIDSSNSQSIADRLAAVSGITGVQGQNIANQMGASGSILDAILASAGGLSQTGQQKAALGQQKFDNAGTAADALLQAGGITDAKRQAELDARINRFYQNDMRDWTRLGALQSAAAGSAGPYGTTWSSTQQPSSFNPLGLLGLLGSFIPSGSDIRIKTDIEPIGRTPGGHTVYAYRYADGAARSFVHEDGKTVGVLAQEVMRTQPEAVEDIDGVLHVVYARLH